MALGLRVEPQALRGTGGKLHGLGDQAGGLLSKAAGAVVHPKSWGLVGMATLYSGYANALPPLHEHLHAVQTTLGAAGDKLDDSAKAYEEADKASGATLNHVGAKLPDIPSAGSDGAGTHCWPPFTPEPTVGHLEGSDNIEPPYDLRDHGYVPRDTADRIGSTRSRGGEVR